MKNGEIGRPPRAGDSEGETAGRPGVGLKGACGSGRSQSGSCKRREPSTRRMGQVGLSGFPGMRSQGTKVYPHLAVEG